MRRRLLSAAPMVVAVLVVVGLVLALGACGAGGSKEEAKARPLPLYPTENALLTEGDSRTLFYRKEFDWLGEESV
jgi:hypothetical protein